MSKMIFDNPLNLITPIVQLRVRNLDALADDILGYDAVRLDSNQVPIGVVHYVAMETSASPLDIVNALSTTGTASELRAVTNYVNSIPSFLNLPNWASWTPADVDANVGGILFGWDKPTADNWVSTNVVDLASAKTALTNLANAIIDLRTVAVNLAKAVLFIRDLLIALRRI